MRHIKLVLVAGCIAALGVVGCVHHEVETPVQSGDSTPFTSSIGPIDHDRSNDDGVGPKGSPPPARANQHSSIKTPSTAEFGSPTGTNSGSGANP